MSRPPLPPSQRRSKKRFVSLRKAEDEALERVRRSSGINSRSAILADSFMAHVEGRLPKWKQPKRGT